MRGAYTEDDVLLGIRQGRFTLWAGEASCVVTLVNRYPAFNTICMFLAAGDLEELKIMHQKIIAAARAEGIARAEIHGPRAHAWGRVLDGYEEISTAYMKEL